MLALLAALLMLNIFNKMGFGKAKDRVGLSVKPAFKLLSKTALKAPRFNISEAYMKDKFDDRTVDLIPKPKSNRGRNPVGLRAMTDAEKQAAYRKRQAEKKVTVTFDRDDINTLKRLIGNPDSSLNFDKSAIERLAEAVFQAAKKAAK